MIEIIASDFVICHSEWFLQIVELFFSYMYHAILQQ
jgi:hypothetical protein